MISFNIGEIGSAFAVTVALMLILPYNTEVWCNIVSAVTPLVCLVIYKAALRNFVTKRRQKYMIILIEYVVVILISLFVRFAK